MSNFEIKEKRSAIHNAWHELQDLQNDESENDALKQIKANNLNDIIDTKQNEIEYLRLQRPGISDDHYDSDNQCEDALRNFKPVTGTKASPIPYAISDTNHGAAFVGIDKLDRIIHNHLHNSHALRQLSRIVKTNQSTYDIVLDSANIPLTSGGWALEPSTIGSINPTDATVVTKSAIQTYSMFAQPLLTQKMLQDTQFNIVEWIISKASDMFADAEEQAFLNGSTPDRPSGILSGSISTSSTVTSGTIQAILSGVSGGLTADSIIQLYYALDARFIGKAAFLMHPTLMAQIRLLKDSTGNYLWQPAYSGDKETLLGVPVYRSSYMPTASSGSYSLMVGDMKSATIIVDRSSSLNILPDPFSYKPLVAYYITKRVGFAVVNTNAIKLLKLGTV